MKRGSHCVVFVRVRARRRCLDASRSSKDDLVIGVEVIGELEAVDSTDIKPPPIADMWDFKIAQMAARGRRGQGRRSGDLRSTAASRCASSRTCRTRPMPRRRSSTRSATMRRSRGATTSSKIAEAEATLRKASLKTAAPTDLVASIEAKEIELDEQSAKLALDAAKQHAEAAKRSDDEEVAAARPRRRRTRSIASRSCSSNIAKLQVTAPRAGTVVLSARTGRARSTRSATACGGWRTCCRSSGSARWSAHGQVDEVDIAKRRRESGR